MDNGGEGYDNADCSCDRLARVGPPALNADFAGKESPDTDVGPSESTGTTRLRLAAREDIRAHEEFNPEPENPLTLSLKRK